MTDFLMWAGGIIITGLFSLIGWVINMIFGKIKEHEDFHQKLEDSFNAHRLYSANTYTTKSDIKSVKDEIVNQLNRIEDRIERLQENK